MIELVPIHKVIAGLSVLYALLIICVIYLLKGASFPFSEALSIAIGGFTIFSLSVYFVINHFWRYIWKKYPKLETLVFPDLNGQWEMTIKYNTEADTGVKKATATIKQNLITLSMRVDSEDSSSRTLVAKPIIDLPDKVPGVYYVFKVTPEYKEGKKRDPYDGFAKLIFGLKNKNELSGNYHTSSMTFGHFSLRPKVKSK